MNILTRKLVLGAFLSLILNMTVSLAQSTSSPANLRQITTYPATDVAARVSPDGKWMAYASNRAGNYDIWIKNLQTGRSRQITTHKSDDFYPVWDKKQRYIIFVSQRRDAKGDIYRINLRSVVGEIIPKGEPERLTTYMGFDGYPTISEYDEHIAWVSDRTGRSEIWLMTKHREDIRQLTHGGATHPSWSPKQSYLAFTSFRDDSCNGDIWIINLYARQELFEAKTRTDSLERPMWPVTRGPAADGFPTWSADANSLVFVRADMDTDGDGAITLADQTSLWQVQVHHTPNDSSGPSTPVEHIFQDSFNWRLASAARQLTPPYLRALQPDWASNGTIYFCSAVKGNYDIWMMNEADQAEYSFAKTEQSFPLPKELQDREIANLVFYAFRDSHAATDSLQLWDRLCAFQRLAEQNESADIRWPALYETGLCYFLLGHQKHALRFFTFLLQQANDSESAAWAETLLSIADVFDRQAPLEHQLENMIKSVKQVRASHHEAKFHGSSLLLLAELWEQVDADTSEKLYRSVCRTYASFRDLCAHSLFNLGRLAAQRGDQQEALKEWLNIMQSFPETRWAVTARDSILNRAVIGLTTDAERISAYLNLHQQYKNITPLAMEAWRRAAALHARHNEYGSALAFYDSLLNAYQSEGTLFPIRMQRIDLLVEAGEILTASRALDSLRLALDENTPEFAAVKSRLADLLISTAADLASSGRFDLAARQYQRIIEFDADNIKAHQGYIRVLDQKGEIDQVIAEYKHQLIQSPQNNILLYGLGLSLSCKGARVENGQFDPAEINPDLLQQSNATLRKALSLDYTLIDAYLTLSFNYEMLEHQQRWAKTRQKSFVRKAGDTFISPFLWLVHTITFYEERRAPRYYESAIEELTKALALNDEEAEPTLEALLARNMANNYYNLGEFGFRKAYEYYHHSLRYDSTFANKREQALVYERMGHCAIFVNDQEKGSAYLKRAIRLFRELKDSDRVLINTKRLALLYEIGENSAQAVRYYQAAAEMEKQRGFYDGLMRSYRSIAYHNFVMQNPATATAYANRALALMDSGMVTRSYGKPIYLQFGVLGLYAPFPYDLRKLGAKSAFQLSTDEEEAFIYTIFARDYLDKNEYEKAIAFIKKKFAIYEQRHDYDALAIFQNNMGQIYYTKGDYDLAWRWFTNAYWMCRKTKYIGGQLLNITNAAYVVLTIANDPDPGKRENLLKYYNWITNKIRELLTLTADQELTYAFYHTHLNLLLGELMLVDANPEDEARDIAQTARIMRRATEADSLLRRALALSKKYKFAIEEASIHFRLGKLHAFLGEAQAAFAEFQKSRDMAIQNKLPELVWQTMTEMGTTIEQLRNNAATQQARYQEPLTLYLQAIRLSETNRVRHPGVTASRMRDLYRQPYERAVRRHLTLGDTLKAVQTAERLRERILFESLEREQLYFFDERQQLLFHRADSLQTRLNAIEAEMLQKGAALSQADRQKHIDAMTQVQEEYDKTLAVIKNEAPALRALISISPISVTKLQKRLPQKLRVIYLFATPYRIHLAQISHNSIRFSQKSFSRKELHKQATAFARQLRDGHTARPDSTLELLFQEMEKLAGSGSVVLIPEVDMLLLPWTSMCRLAGRALDINSTTTNLTTLYYALDCSPISSRRVFVAGDSKRLAPLQFLNFERSTSRSTVSGTAFDSQRAAMAEAEAIHLAVKADWNTTWPSRSRFRFTVADSQQAAIAAIDMFRLKKSSARFVSLDIDSLDLMQAQPEPLFVWERALAFTGIPALMMPLWADDDSTLTFYNEFYRQVDHLDLATAKSRTDSLLRHSHIPQQKFAAYQVFGFAASQRNQERTKDTESLLAQLHRAYRQRQWQRIIEVAADSTINMLDKNERLAIMDEVVKAALIIQDWDTAINSQRSITANLLRQKEYSQAAEAYSLLELLYQLAGNRNRAEFTRNKNETLAKRFGLQHDPVHALVQAARILVRGGEFSRAQALFDQAAMRYEQQQNRVQQGRVLIESAQCHRIFQHEFNAALAKVERAQRMAQVGEAQLLKSVWLEKSSVYKDLGLWHKALYCAHKADSIATDLGSADPQSILALASIYFEMREFKGASQALARLDSIASGEENIRVRRLALSSQLAAEMGQTSLAKTRAEHALLLAKSSGDLQLINDMRDNYALILMMQNQAEAAVEQWRELLRSEILSATDSMRTLLHYGATLIAAGHSGSAAMPLTKAYQLARREKEARAAATAALLRAQCQRKTNKAAQLLNEAVSLSESLQMNDIGWRARAGLAQLSIDDPQRSKAEYKSACRLLFRSAATTHFHQINNALFYSESQFFHDYTAFLLRQDDPVTALAATESRKLRQYQYQMADREFVTTRLKRRGFASIDSLREEYSLQCAKARSTWTPDALSSSSLPAQSARRPDKRIENIAAGDRLLTLCFSTAPLEASGLPTSIAADKGIIVYSVLGDSLLSWYLDDSGIEFLRLAARESDLEQIIGKFLSALSNFEPNNQQAYQLYELLLRPWEERFGGKRHLAIVPDGVLHRLPFAALRSDSLGYLGLNYAISTAAQLYNVTPPAGNPLNENTPIAAIYRQIESGNNQINFAAFLGETLARYYNNVNQLPSDMSLRENLHRAASFPISYLGATWVRSTSSMNGDGLADLEQKEIVPTSKILNSEWRSTLVVIFNMSRAKTAERDQVDELPSHLMAAGANAVVVPQWESVDLAASAILLKRLFRQTAASGSPERALQEARQLVYDQVNPNPAYWAGYRLMVPYATARALNFNK